MAESLPKWIIAWILLSLFGYTVIAQTQHPNCPQSGRGYGIVGTAASLTGCPFSATVEGEIKQRLPDGTRTAKNLKALVYRDSAGRIRYEMYPPTDRAKDLPEAPNMIHIFDPVAGFWYGVRDDHQARLDELLDRSGGETSIRGDVVEKRIHWLNIPIRI